MKRYTPVLLALLVPSLLTAQSAADVPAAIQERAYTSPIWYTPGG